MKLIYVYVEGQTEETFVTEILAEHFQQIGIHPVPILAKTKREKSGRSFRGGITSYGKVKQDILNLLRNQNVTALTTMIDFYNLPEDFPGKRTLPVGSPYQKVEHLQRAWYQDINDRRFIPFITLHEFEALLFTDPAEIKAVFSDLRLRRLVQEVARFNSPEEINDGPETHPAARIESYVKSYQKPVHGPLIAKRIGLQQIRRACTHFNNWIIALERLA